jgi:hypothetical protein
VVSESSRIAISDRSGWLRRLAGMLLLATGLALMAFTTFNLIQDASLWVLGRPTEAQVIGVWIEQAPDDSPESPSYRWFVRYRFETLDGRVVTGVSRIAATELAALGHTEPVDVVYAGEQALHESDGAIEDGGRVDVVYFPAYPAHNRLDESRFVPLLACAYVPLILLGLAGLVVGRSYIQNSSCRA